MSRILMVLVLAILLGLLAVMANIVNPKPAPPPSVEQQQAKETEQRAMQEKALEQEKRERKNMMAMREKKTKEWQEKQRKIEQQLAGKKKLPSPKESTEPPTSSPTSMEISHDWFKKRQDGEQGLKDLDKLQKALEEAAKKQQADTPSPGSAAKTAAPH